jgi:hypothetical protein
MSDLAEESPGLAQGTEGMPFIAERRCGPEERSERAGVGLLRLQRADHEGSRLRFTEIRLTQRGIGSQPADPIKI